MNSKDSPQLLRSIRPEGQVIEKQVVTRFIECDGRIEIILGDKSGDVAKVEFDSYIAFRNIDESFRLRTWNDHTGFPGTYENLGVVENSKWCKWLVEESCGVLSFDTLTHYTIYTGMDCIDIVAQHCEPVITIFGSEEA